jgi:hypothetical protein
MFCAVGWVDFLLCYIFNKSTPENCCIPFKSKDNDKKILPSARFIVGPDILGQSLYKGPNKFFHNVNFMGIQKTQKFTSISEMLTYLSDKMHLKMGLQKHGKL